jgi:hypothetical protein
MIVTVCLDGSFSSCNGILEVLLKLRSLAFFPPRFAKKVKGVMEVAA